MMAGPLLRQEQWARWDVLVVALALSHGVLLIGWPSIPLIAAGLWWNANTISHHFIHRPLFRTRELNAAFSIYLSVLLGFPQSLWRKRHLAHHLVIAGVQSTDFSRVVCGRTLHYPTRVGTLNARSLDFVGVIALWGGLLAFAPRFMLTVYLPGFLLGVALCYLQGHYEHERGTVSHYGWLYNSLFFNDGYHVEHHVRPGAHWRELPRQRTSEGCESRWPAVLRWLECVNLCALERVVLRSRALQRFVLERHERALRHLLTESPPPQRVGIVGGGLFPRTAVILRRLLPESKLTLIDLSAGNLEISRRFVESDVQFINERFECDAPCDFDLLVIPLAFASDRQAIYRRPPAPAVLVHDWIWRRRGSSAIVSWLLLKRLNLVRR